MKDDNIVRINPFLRRLVKEAIAPSEEVWTNIAGRGLVAVIVFEPALTASTQQTLHAFGWRGETCFAMPRRVAKDTARRMDAVTRRWLLSRPRREVPKLFVVVQLATFLLNYSSSQGLTIEPGSLDHEQHHTPRYPGSVYQPMLWFPPTRE